MIALSLFVAFASLLMAFDYLAHKQAWHCALFTLFALASVSFQIPQLLTPILIALSIVLFRISFGRFIHLVSKRRQRLGQTA